MAADAEATLVEWLTNTAFPGTRVVTEVPADIEAAMPFIRVARIGGNDDHVPVFDNPTVDFDCYAASRIEARDMCHEVRDEVRYTLPGATVGDVFISRVRTMTGPRQTPPFDNPTVRRFTYSAQLRVRDLTA